MRKRVSMSKTQFSGRLLMVGFGSIGQGVLPLLLEHVDISRDRIAIVAADSAGAAVAKEYGIAFDEIELTRDNYLDVLTPRLDRGDFLLNLSVEVSSADLIEFCHKRGVLYLDTCTEPWPGHYTNPDLTPSQRSNYASREDMLTLRRRLGTGPTAVITHGCNPGWVSHVTKQALLDVARDRGIATTAPTTRDGWAALSRKLGVKAIQISERDAQVSTTPRRLGEFVNTWSIEGFVAEGCQPAELGWGTHETRWPAQGDEHAFGERCAIFLNRPGANTRVKSWSPAEGPFNGFLITHSESISIASYLTSLDEHNSVVYRPTVYYAYHPCDDAVMSLHELAGKNWEWPENKRLIVDDIEDGRIDEIGIFLLGMNDGRSYWLGSQISIDDARQRAPRSNATTLLVTAPTLAGVIWAMENPDRGLVEPEEMDHDRVLEISNPYLEPIVGEFTDWTPLKNRQQLFPEPHLAPDDPWQFVNFLDP